MILILFLFLYLTVCSEYSGCTVFSEEHAIGLFLLSERMRLPRLQCGALRYLALFLRLDNVLPVWRALQECAALHAARAGSALQLRFCCAACACFFSTSQHAPDVCE